MKTPYWLLSVLCFAALTGCGTETRKTHTDPVAGGAALKVNWFEYQGKDAIFEEPLAAGEYQNPIMAGFYPDPSIVRAGDTYYMVHSSFAFTPGVPIFRSTDLVNWQPLGHVLTRPAQVDVTGAGISRGIYAPTIRYNKGVFYMITTGVDSGGNFLVTSTNPEEGWSDPLYLPEINGIDPSMFFDDDGRVYITHNDAPEGEPLYEGHRAIWMWEFDLARKKVLPDSGRVIVNGGVDLSRKPIWIEGPHIYKINGWYYLLCAEGGTAEDHSEVVFRTRSLDAPFVPYEGNPILTQRDLPDDRVNPIATAGHADMVQTPDGNWWAVFLATRNYQQKFYNTGRETFLLPVTWRDGWPHITQPGEKVSYRPAAPKGLPPTEGAVATTGNISHRDAFTAGELGYQWSLLRSNNRDWLRFADGGGLLVKALPIGLDSNQQPAFIGRRQQNTAFESRLNVALPSVEGVLGGLALFQSEQAHFFLAVKKSGTHYRVVLEKAAKSAPEVVSSKVFAMADTGPNITLEVICTDDQVAFYFQPDGMPRQMLGRFHDARVLSTQWAGGFVGSHVGVHVRAVDSILPLAE